MRKTTQSNNVIPENLTVDTPHLMEMLQVGRATAVQIGTSAEAKITIGRRTIWNLGKIREYLNDISE